MNTSETAPRVREPQCNGCGVVLYHRMAGETRIIDMAVFNEDSGFRCVMRVMLCGVCVGGVMVKRKAFGCLVEYMTITWHEMRGQNVTDGGVPTQPKGPNDV